MNRHRHLDSSADYYLSELGDSNPLSRQEETRLAERIEEAEHRVLDVVLEGGVLLPELRDIARAVRSGTRAPDEVVGSADHPGSIRREMVLGCLDEAQRREHAYLRGLHARAATTGNGSNGAAPAGHDHALRARNEAVRRVGFGRSVIEEITHRVRTRLRGLEYARHRVANAEGAGASALREAHELIESIERELGRPRGELHAVHTELRAAQNRVDTLKAELTRANLRLVVLFAKRHLGREVPFADLVQEGNVALMRAADKFDRRVGTRFSTYAAWWIRQAMERAIVGQSRSVRVPFRMAETVHAARRAARRLAQQLGREPTSAEVAAAIDRSPEEVERMWSSQTSTISLDAATGEPDERPGIELVADEHQVPADQRLMEAWEHYRVRNCVQMLEPREETVVRMRFGIGSEGDHTLQEIGYRLGLSRERVRQIESRALRKLQQALQNGAAPDATSFGSAA